MNSRLTFSLHNYRAVKAADIRIEGITVLAGSNGCGKSTLARWLSYAANGINNFESLIVKDYINRVNLLAMKYVMLQSELQALMSLNEALPPASYEPKTNASRDDIGTVRQWADDRFETLLQSLASFLRTPHAPKTEKRLLIQLDITRDNGETETQLTNKLRAGHNAVMNNLEQACRQRLKDRRSNTLASLFAPLIEENEIPIRIKLYEDDVEVFCGLDNPNERVGHLFSLSRAVYVGSPIALAVPAPKPLWWSRLNDLMAFDNPKRLLPEFAKNIMGCIEQLLKGKPTYNPRPDTREQQLTFVTNEGKEYFLRDLAAGFLAFFYIYRLLANGTLNNNSLLIIDEPEAHLHPQWIADFARILVSLNKEAGVKIMVATHSPYMAEGIRVIANGEHITDTTLFYLAEPLKDAPSLYAYRCLNHNTNEIFDTFNTVYDKIDFYGGVGI